MDELLIWAPYDPEGTNILGGFWQVSSAVVPQQRLQNISQWYERGGVLVIGYEMFRNFILNKETKVRGAALNEEVHAQVKKELLKGPNIIIADEAHKMKNANASITAAASQFESSSRIALTGSPLANTVEEYHSMIDWVAPNYLGPAKEFKAKYVEPIQAGLWQDSSSGERRKSLKMLGVLKEDIAPKVHRADVSVLRNDLPPKKEFVITVPLTELQRKAYSLYVNSMLSGTGHRTKDGEIQQSTLWHWLTVLSLLCNHPHCFNEKLNERKGDAKKEAARVEEAPTSREPTDPGEEIAQKFNESIWKVGVSQQLIQDETNLFETEGVDMQSIDLSNKVKILCQILDASRAVKDKVLVFSQSIPTLDFLEKLCIKQGRKYAVLTGKTKISDRQASTKDFNTGDDELYLISTTAGGLGLNLPGANRVVIFDFKFNPIMEEQAVGRAFRIGQQKETVVYRFVTGGTFENTVHNKTIFKMQLASRVVDKKNPIAHAKKNISDFLFEPRDVEQQNLAELKGMDPKVLDRILESQKDACTIRAIVQTDTFELDDDDKLTAEEEKEVKQLIVDEKLKRSNPRAWHELQLRRAGRAVQQAQAPRPAPAMNPGPYNRVGSSIPQSTAGRPAQSQTMPLRQPSLNESASSSGVGRPGQSQPMPQNDTGPNESAAGLKGASPVPTSVSAPKANGNAASPAIKPPSRPTPASGNSAAIARPAIKPSSKPTTPSSSSTGTANSTIKPPSKPVAVSTNSAGAESPAIMPPPRITPTAANSAGAAAQGMNPPEKWGFPVLGTFNSEASNRNNNGSTTAPSSTPDRGRSPNHNVNISRASSGASGRATQSTPQTSRSNSTSRLARSEQNVSKAPPIVKKYSNILERTSRASGRYLLKQRRSQMDGLEQLSRL
jgi:superfamily II DNA or RNA helicase